MNNCILSDDETKLWYEKNPSAKIFEGLASEYEKLKKLVFIQISISDFEKLKELISKSPFIPIVEIYEHQFAVKIWGYEFIFSCVYPKATQLYKLIQDDQTGYFKLKK